MNRWRLVPRSPAPAAPAGLRSAHARRHAGAAIGLGYRLMGGNGMNIGLQYYQGLIDISVDDQGPNQYNSAFYANVGIPIGKGKAQKKQQEKK